MSCFFLKYIDVIQYNLVPCSQGMPGLPGIAGLNGQKVSSCLIYVHKWINGFVSFFVIMFD